MTPVKIRSADGGALHITWADGMICVYPPAHLRRNCPCAECRAEAEQQAASYIPLYTRNALALEAVTPVGRYAVQLHWKDGHSSGIYTYDYLRELCPGSLNRE